jgi:hypothetical protein
MLILVCEIAGWTCPSFASKGHGQRHATGATFSCSFAQELSFLVVQLAKVAEHDRF